MTTKLIPISEITVAVHERQRKAVGNVHDLAASFRRTGQINPISVTPDLILIAGERRLSAAKSLGWDTIRATIRDEEPTEVQRLVELEENISREELPWKDHCLAVLDLHEILSGQTPGWTQGKTAKYMGLSASAVRNYITVAAALISGEEFTCSADRFTVALNYLTRQKERESSDELSSIGAMLSPTPAVTTTTPAEQPAPTAPQTAAPDLFTETPAALSDEAPAPFFHTDFTQWAAGYSGPKFNFIHCDFPYGINVEKHHGAGSSYKGYDDSADVYFNLLETLAGFMENGVASSAHLLFWYSFQYHAETVAALTKMGWKVQQRPLIWHRSDNSGVLPDPKRGPRWVYETALMATRGDRPVVQAVSDLIGYPNLKKIHKSEKPINMLHHFFRMFVDKSTRMLDPTAGSGNAVYTAETMGAATVLGLERDEDFYKAAVAEYRKNKAMFKEV